MALEPLDISPVQSGLTSGRTRSTRYVILLQAIAIGPVQLFARALRGSVYQQLSPQDMRNDKTYIIVSNHQSILDPFIIIGSLSQPLWRRLSPYRFFAHNGLFMHPIKRVALLAIGSFPTRPFGTLAYGLAAAEQFIALNETVLIFPQGKRTRVQNDLKPGIAHLSNIPNVMLIPVRIEWAKRGILPIFSLGIGKPFLADGQTPNEIMKKVFELPLKNEIKKHTLKESHE
jgi:1-acyl-sn-glycerol-3-phosphate acyltransferase